MPVNSVNHQYSFYSPVWEMIDDFVLGEKQVKGRELIYLPTKEDWSDEEYLQYLEEAPFTNITTRTVNALLGAMFLKEPLIKLPSSIEYLRDNCDGKGNSVLQLVRRMSLEAIKKGRSGVFVDFPRTEAGQTGRKLSIAEAEQVRASISLYDARNIINWKEDDLGLTLVVLQETYEESLDDFASDIRYQYRVLKREGGVYFQQIWRDGSIIETITPRDYNSQPLSYIPFFFNGAVNNDADVDGSPIYEIVSKNKTHYQLEAKIMRSINYVGSPMPVISIGDIPSDQFLALNGLDDGSALKFGSSRGLILGMQGSAELLQAKPNDMAQSKADKVIQEAIMLGARLVTKSAGRMTAEQVRIESSAETGVINSIAKNIEDTMLAVFRTVQQFVAPSIEKSTFSMNTEFVADSPDAQLLQFAATITESNMMPLEDLFNLLRRSGLFETDRTWEEVKKDLQGQKTVLETLGVRDLDKTNDQTMIGDQN